MPGAHQEYPAEAGSMWKVVSGTAVAAAAVALFLAGACQCGPAAPPRVSLGKEGDPCTEDAQCETALCQGLPGEAPVCRRKCSLGCRADEQCESFGALDDLRHTCVPAKNALCRACQGNYDCPYPGDACVDFAGTSVCGRDCSFDSKCPEGYVCSDAIAHESRAARRQCLPASGSCDCTPKTGGATRGCAVRNSFGQCAGTETCDPQKGWVGCNAKIPQAERCNAEDDDCNGQPDDGLGTLTCGSGNCRNTVPACLNGVPQNCTAPTPGPEICDGQDNDCDGATDATDADLVLAPCERQQTLCAGTKHRPGQCAAGAWASCDATNYGADFEAVESRCDGRDNDCDGAADAQDPDLVLAACDKSLGVCAGKRHASAQCTAGGWLPCTAVEYGADYEAVESRCDGKDNDCDGAVDEATSFDTDMNNCGSCGNVCAVANGIGACTARTCRVATCNAGFADCDLAYPNGCEMSLYTVANCGACGTQCVNVNGTTSCPAGVCVPACSPGFASCDGNPNNGCETDLSSSVGHCGVCGRTCTNANGSTACVIGLCTPSCTPGFGDCNGNRNDGCETSLNMLTNCGVCGRACTNANGTTACLGGACSPTCNPGWASCDGDPTNGCETSTTTLSNCGGCGVPCSRSNATATCATGTCGIATCSAGWGDCDGNDPNGCETQTTTVSNCGSCGVTCTNANGSTACVSGQCSPTCNPNWASCDSNPNNGCETATNTLANCGGCGVACSRTNATATCATGTCQIASCNAGWANCDGSDSNGCERLLDTNPALCSPYTDMGTVRGDTGADATATYTGFGEGIFKVRVLEASSSWPVYISANISLQSPSGLDYDLYARWVCGNAPAGALTGGGAGGLEVLNACSCDGFGSNDSFDVWIEVRYRSGAACGIWQLWVQGNVPFCAAGPC